MATVRTSDRGILRAEQFRAFQVWLVEQGHSVQEEGELIFWCSTEPKGAPNSSVSVGIDDICVTSYDLRETVRRFQDSLVKRVDDLPKPKHESSVRSGYIEELRNDFAIAALRGICANPDFSQDMCDSIADMAYKQADAMLKRRLK